VRPDQHAGGAVQHADRLWRPALPPQSLAAPPRCPGPEPDPRGRLKAMTAQLKSSTQDGTMVLLLSNPTQRNALGPDMYAAGIETLNRAGTSADVRSVVLAGEGPWFSAGGSLQRLQANREREPEYQAQSIEGLHNWIEAMRAFPKPIIAAVE